MQFHDMIDSIEDALTSGRNLQFVMELIRLLTAELGERFRNPDSAAAYRQTAAEARAYEDEMRASGDWRERP